MNGTSARFLRLGVSLSGLVILGWVLAGQAAQPAKPGIPLPTDWSHSHLIFSRPGSAELLARVSEDPRYQQQIHRREQALTLPASADAEALPAAILKVKSKTFHRDWSEDLGSLASVGPVLAGVYPAKYSFSSAVANCGSATKPDYVVYSTGLLGTTTQANIVAFDNLYSGCGVGVPTLYWAYNTAGQVLTSPVPSLDGTQVAFVQTNGAGAGTLVLVRWQASTTDTIGSPSAPSLVCNGSYRTCPTLPCMTMITLRDQLGVTTDDTTSSVYYDYTNDIGWVGGARGWLHKITGMFNGTPAEVHGGGFPAQVTSMNPTSSPVYDRLSNNVFVGDGGGFLNSVNATSGVVTQSAEADFGVGLMDSPVVDTVNGLVYVFASSDGSAACTGGADCAAVFQFPVTFSAAASGAEVSVGNSTVSGTNPNPLHIGGFDSAYYKSVNATGNLYVCGNTGANATLYQVPVTAGVLSASQPITALASGSSTAACSPVTDVPNPNTPFGPSERIFVSVQGNGLPTACSSGGCVLNFVSAAWKPSTNYAVGQQVLSSNLHVETVITAGKSSAAAFSWTSSAGALKTDGTVVWIDQGLLGAGTIAGWLATHHYASSTGRILDTNFDVQVSTTPGITGGSPPIWNTTPGLTTPDGTVVWTNAGRIGTFALGSKGGTSGIISDNAVGAGTLIGASQIYFTTLADQTCPTSGGSGGCAVQASQPALQ